jgi:DNA-binding CsgD family transcriptional regulator
VDAIRYLVRAANSERIALVLTYRSEELPALNPLRNELLRATASELVVLPPFTRDEVAEHVAALTGEPASAADIQHLHARTAGNPYFVEELVRVGVWRDGPAPDTLRGLLAERVGAAEPATQRLLRLLAVAGRPCAYREMVGSDLLGPAELDQAIQDACGRHLMVDEDGDWQRFRLRHPVVGEVLSAGCPPNERQALHRAFARGLTTVDGSSAAELAWHWDAAGEVAPALVARVRAAAEAGEVAGHAQAWRHWQRALALWAAVADGPTLTGLDEGQLRYRAATSARWAGAPAEAVRLLEVALSELDGRSGTAGERRAALLDLLARCLREAGDGRAATAVAERAAEALRGAPDSPLVARALANLAAAHLVRSRYREAVETAREAIRAGEATGALAEVGHAANTLGVGLVMSGATAAGLAALERAGRIAADAGCLEDRLRAANNLSYAYLNSGRYRAAADTALDGHRLAQRHGVAATGGALLLTNAATALVWLGAWAEADKLARDGLAPAPDGLGPSAGLAAALYLARAEAAVGAGEQVVAEQLLSDAEQAAAGLDEPQVMGHLAACRAELALWRRDPAGSMAAVRAGLAALSEAEDYQLMLRLAALGLRAAADQAEVAFRRVDDGRYVADEWRALVGKLAAGLPPVESQPEAHADACTARAEEQRLDAASDAALWSAAAERWEAIERPYPAAYCRWRAAEALLATKAPQRGRIALSQAHELAHTIGARPLLDEIAALARRKRIALGRPPAPRAPADPHGLTAREREVLALLCDGLTNRQIARRLLMSEKTASVHVSRILTKLNTPTRGAAAAVASRVPSLLTS